MLENYIKEMKKVIIVRYKGKINDNVKAEKNLGGKEVIRKIKTLILEYCWELMEHLKRFGEKE